MQHSAMNTLLWIALAVVCALVVAARHSHSCKNTCDSSDPFCNEFDCVITHRKCCNGSCVDKRQPCPGNKSRMERYNLLNESAYQARLDRYIKTLSDDIQAKKCSPHYRCVNETTCKSEYYQCRNGWCKELASECEPFWKTINDDKALRNNFLGNQTCFPIERCRRKACSSSYWMCNNGECISTGLVCRGGKNCIDGSDENYCNGTCFPPNRCYNDTCKYGYFACGDGECIYQENVCDAIYHCSDKSDEANCQTCWPEKACDENLECIYGYFPCGNGKCIDSSRVCDQRRDCLDGSDEIRIGFGFKCMIGSNFDTCVLSQNLLEDGHATRCADYADDCSVNGTYNCFRCFDGKFEIAGQQVCDGVIDCHDFSDECLCPGSFAADSLCQSICTYMDESLHKASTFTFRKLSNTSHWRSNHSKRKPNEAVFDMGKNRNPCVCKPGHWQCDRDDEMSKCINFTQVCDGVPDCNASVTFTMLSSDEANCMSKINFDKKMVLCPGDVSNTTQIEALACDGRPECYDLSDECGAGCKSTPPFCRLAAKLLRDKGSLEILCDRKYVFLDVKQICDGAWSQCSPRLAEEETDCPARFYCQSRGFFSVDKNVVCDGHPHCDDYSDELNCTNRFYCESGVPFSIAVGKKLDGIPDCSDQSDECPKEMEFSAFASRTELFGAPVFRVTTWIMAFTSTFGNLATFAGSLSTLYNYGSLTPIARVNTLILINLSVADFLMGFYLFFLCGQSLAFSGIYCQKDKAWRSSVTCSTLGAIALVSSEASLLILVLLTTTRVYFTKFPFKSQGIGVFVPLLFCALIWAAAVVLAVIPNMRRFNKAFVTHVLMPTNFSDQELKNKASLTRLVQRLAVIKPSGVRPPQSGSWYEETNYLKEFYPQFDVRGFFGFFSTNSVCLPKFYATTDDSAWAFSIGIMVFNLAAFVYISLCYWVVFRSAAQGPGKVSKRMKMMQRRIAFLVLTNCICWTPIIVLSFISIAGVRLSKAVYAVSAVILLPINSALNPLLYSDVTKDRLVALFQMLRYAALAGYYKLTCSSQEAPKSNVAALPNNNKTEMTQVTRPPIVDQSTF